MKRRKTPLTKPGDFNIFVLGYSTAILFNLMLWRHWGWLIVMLIAIAINIWLIISSRKEDLE